MRFDYQKNWAFCQMLQHHIDGDDYLVAFEFHDDVVFFDASVAPKAANFVQVKTQADASARSVTSLLSRKKLKGGGHGGSILGKMCLHFDGVASDVDVTVTLVSSNPYEFSGKDLSFSSLQQKHKKRIEKAIAKEVSGFDGANLQKMNFRISGIPVDKMSTFVQGAAVDLFAHKFGSTHPPVLSWVRFVQGEITRKNNYVGPILTSADIVAKKCVGRAFIDDTLEFITSLRAAPVDWQSIRDELKSEGWMAPDLIRLEKALARALVDLQDPSNVECQGVVDLIEQDMKAMDLDSIPLSALIAALAPVVANKLDAKSPYREDWYLRAAIVLVRNEKL